jgi:GntR family transcriptional regulator/MocR family aminotransferase
VTGGRGRADLPISLPPIDRASARSLQEQLYDGLRSAILTGQLRGGVRIPASRRLATDLGISRNTVTLAVEQLVAEGFLEARVGAGTFVASTVPDHLVTSGTGRSAGPGTHALTLSRRGRLMTGPALSRRRSDFPRAFWPGIAAPESFPAASWSRLIRRHTQRADRELLGYGDPAGYRPLQEAIAGYLATTRGVRCDADRVIVVGGSQAALNLCARLLLDPDDIAAIEDPGYPPAREAFAGAGASVLPVPVDAGGLVVTRLHEASGVRLVYTTPSHQFPTGATMGIERRLALLDWARMAGAWILEDDYDGEFRYAGRPLPALQGLDSDDRVIYVGTFSKVLAPGLQIGYLVVPPQFSDSFAAARAQEDRGAPALEQAALADLIMEGGFERHVRRTRMLYAERQAAFISEVNRQLPGLIDVRPAAAGMHLLGLLPSGTNAEEVSRLAAPPLRVAAPALSTYAVATPVPPALLLGYAAAGTDEMRAGVHDLGVVLRTLARRTRT